MRRFKSWAARGRACLLRCKSSGLSGEAEGWSPRGGWNLDEVTPSDLPEGSYELTFGDRNEKNPGGISKQGEAHLRGGTWTVEDVRDA